MADQFITGWNDHLRKVSKKKMSKEQRGREAEQTQDSRHWENRITCSACDASVPDSLDDFTQHVQEEPTVHSSLTDTAAIQTFFKSLPRDPPRVESGHDRRPGRGQGRSLEAKPQSSLEPKLRPETPESPGDGVDANASHAATENSSKERAAEMTSSKPSSIPRSRARNASGWRLWEPGDPPEPKPNPASPFAGATSPRRRRQPHKNDNRGGPLAIPNRNHPDSDIELQPGELVKQLATRAISQEQLVTEVKGIYAGLILVESKCMDVDSAQAANKDSEHPLSKDQWQALIALHRTLLHEHHDFFLASQHPSAHPPLQRLAAKYAMPARMWRHGIHSFLELLRHRLPESLEYMLTFIYLAYSMLALLYETVPAFEDTWIECLGDLSRYRMAIEDDDIRDRETWTSVSRHWYSKASEKSPTTGRLYHHLAILARPNALQQLFFYAKSLCVPIPFPSAKESVMTLFNPLLETDVTRLAPVDAAFVRVHGVLFSGKSLDKLPSFQAEFIDLLDSHIARTTRRWLESGYHIGIALNCSLLEYGAPSNILMKTTRWQPGLEDVTMSSSSDSETSPTETFELALAFTVSTYETVLRRWGDTNTLPFIHTILVFVAHLTTYPEAMAHIEDSFPWKMTALMLNHLKLASSEEQRFKQDEMPRPAGTNPPRPLPEDFAMRGLTYAEDYFPADWFSSNKIEEDEKFFEMPSMTEERRERILWLGYQIASRVKWLAWYEDEQKFSVVAKYDVDLGEMPTAAASEKTLFPDRMPEDIEMLSELVPADLPGNSSFPTPSTGAIR